MEARWVFAACALALSGCANLTSISRTTSLNFDHDGDKQKGVAIHLDAKQRLVLQKGYGVVCAEPNPDALSAVAASSSASFTGPSDNDVALTNEIAESAGNIGLRTQSIQLMRDSLYRVCEMYFSRALNDVQVMMLHQKYQDVLVAVLAIEQLTGVVPQTAVALSGSAKGDALSRSHDIAQDLVDARKTLAGLEAELATLNGEVAAAEAKVTTAKEEVNVASNTEPPPADLDALKQALEEKTEAKDQMVAKRDAKKGEVQSAKEYVEVLVASKDAMLRQVRGEASSTAEVRLSGGAQLINQHTVSSISTAVQSIVKDVVGKDYKQSACLSLITDLNDEIKRYDYERAKLREINAATPAQVKERDSKIAQVDERETNMTKVVDMCLKVLAAVAAQ